MNAKTALVCFRLRRLRRRWFVAAALPLASACSGGGSGTVETIDITNASLRRAQSCADLTQALRSDALSKMNRRIDAEIRGIREGWSYYGGEGDTPTPMMGPGGATPAGQTNGASATPVHSDTETQVKGVDEADIVKADGTSLYVLHGQKLFVVNAWPAQTLATAGSVDLEGQPLEMFVANGQAVVFSTVDGAPIYAAAGLAPRPEYDDSYSYGGPMYAGGGVAMATPAGGAGYPGGGYVGYQNPLTKVTVLALQGGSATVTRELYFEGSYLSSRRVDTKVRIVLEGGAHGPTLDYAPSVPSSSSSSSTVLGQPYQAPTDEAMILAWESLRAKNAAAIGATTYADWVPTAFTKDASGITATPTSCADFYVPSTGTTEFGMTQIEAIDLSAPSAAPRSSAIVGAVDTVYGDTTTMVLAGHAYVDPWTTRQTFGTPPTGAAVPVETLSYTHLHLFDLSADPTQPLYAGSGTVPGDVKDQFSLDQHAGFVRVATTEQRSGPSVASGTPNEVSHVYVLANHEGRLGIQGDAGEIAPGEQLYAVRFVGDMGYVVTWHVTDPLFVVDVSDASHPTVLGQVQIPGFSEYMHPLDATHLLTIGRETDMTGHQHTSAGYWYGIAVQIFDVTNPLGPALVQKYVYDGGEYATSEATQNHKAFTYFDDRQLLAFPYVREVGYGTSPTQGPSSTLEVFHVDVAAGIQKLGSVDHTSLLGTLPDGTYGYCGGYFDGAVRRGVFFDAGAGCTGSCDTVVYSISYGGVLANAVTNLTTPIATLALPKPTMSGVGGVSCQ
jgi:hypothetical protein